MLFTLHSLKRFLRDYSVRITGCCFYVAAVPAGVPPLLLLRPSKALRRALDLTVHTATASDGPKYVSSTGFHRPFAVITGWWFSTFFMIGWLVEKAFNHQPD